MTSRVVAISLVVLGVVLTAAGLFGQFVLTDDEGHHDGREPTFALSSVDGADQLVLEPSEDGAIAASVERAGQVLVDYDEVHDARFHVFSAATDLTHYAHRVYPEISPDGRYTTGPLPPGEHRVVVQAAPAGGPDLLELGADAPSSGGPDEEQLIVVDEWTDGDLTITRQGLDFVLSEPWSGEDHLDAPAFLAMFREGDLAFVHAHAQVVGDERFSFALDLPGRGEYLAALEFVQDGELVTALFRFEV